MAFHNHLSHEMALQHFTEQHLGENTAVLRSIIPEQLGQTSSDGTGGAGKEQKDIQRLMIETGGKPKQQQPPPGQQHHLGGGGGGGGPTWLSNAILRQQNQYVDGSFLHLQTNSDSPTSAASNQWLPRPILQRNASDVGGGDDVPVSSDSMIAAAMSHNSADLNANNDNRNSGNNQNPGDNSGGAELAESEAGGGGDGVGSWQNAKYKADILAHPLYEQLLSAHVACLRIATPVDQLPRIDAQLAQSQHVVAKYSVLGHGNQQLVSDDKELDQFMIRCAIESGGKKLEIPATSLVGTLAYRCKGFNAKAVRCNSFCHDCDLPSWFRNSNGSMEPRLSRKEGDKVVQKIKLGNREQSLNKLNA